jgi:hypothetical protein
MIRSTCLLALALGAALGAVACEDKKATTDARPVDGGVLGTDKYATADPKLAKALQASASDQPDDGKGPPPDGIFAPGAADKRHRAGAPTNVDLIAQGSEPQIDLSGPTADGGHDLRAPTGPGVLELMVSMGQRNAFVLDFALSLGLAKKDDGGPDWLVAEVKRASPGDRQYGQLPAGADKDVASLEGSLLRMKVTADGRESDLEVRPGKSLHGELQPFALDATEALVFATVPLPPKPVGVGGQWIAETRMPLSGLDVIVYRAYRVKEIDGDRVHLTLSGKAYAANADVKLPGVPKGASLEQFDSQSQGELELVRGESMARKADVQRRTVLIFRAPGEAPPAPGQPPPAGAGNMLTAQLGSQATFIRGDDLRSAAK